MSPFYVIITIYFYIWKRDSMNIVKLSVNDVVELKKNHPCGSKEFKILRVGSDVRLLCCGCGRDMTLDREKLEKAIRRITPSDRQQV